MLAHEWYDANFDEELRMDRQRAKDLCFEYNHTRPSDRETTSDFKRITWL